MEKLFDTTERTGAKDLQERMTLLGKVYEEICGSDQVTEKQKGQLIDLAGQQNEETGFWEFVKGDVPSDVRVDFRYMPTYYVTAMLIKAFLVSGKLKKNEMISQALAKGLDASSKRQFEGHGYEALDGYLEAASIFVKAGADSFVQTSADLSPAFSALWEKARGRLTLLAYASLPQGFGDPGIIREKAMDILKELDKSRGDLKLGKGESFYFAFGSNMDEAWMKRRCPQAHILGPSLILDYELTYRESRSGFYASIDPKEGAFVPILIWILNEEDLHRLDRCEGVGHPECYTRTRGQAQYGLGIIEGCFYRLPPSRPKGKPDEAYIDLIQAAYMRWGFDEHALTPTEVSDSLHL